MDILKNSSREFWDMFVSETWQKKSVLVKNFEDKDLIEKGDSYLAFCEGFKTHLNRQGVRTNIKVFVNGTPLSAQQCYDDGYFPSSEDKNIDEYFCRIKSEMNSDEICAVVDRAGLPALARDVVYGILTNVYSRLGYIAPGSFAFMFFGEYTKTPFGAHIHDCPKECDSTFIISLEGEKTVWVWPELYENQYPEVIGKRDLDEYIADAQVLTAIPGEMIYFASNMLHVGESRLKGSFNLFLAAKPYSDCINMFLGYLEYYLPEYFSGDELRLKKKVVDILKIRYEKSVSEIAQRNREHNTFPISYPDIQSNVNHLPDALVAAKKVINGYFTNEFSEEIIRKYWLGTLSSLGLISPPLPFVAKPLERFDHIKLRQYHHILYGFINNALFISAAGEVFKIDTSDNERSISLIDTLTLRDRVNVACIIGEGDCCSDNSIIAEEQLALLNKLNALGIFKVNEI